MPDVARFHFRDEFQRKMKEYSLSFDLRGILTADDKILTLGTDTKVLSTFFELFCRAIVGEIAHEHELQVETAPQTVYPDFTILSGAEDPEKVAVDIKTTYRQDNGNFGFTIGSYTSFLRNDTKNILHRYSTYAEHWIIGFVYTRSPQEESKVYGLADRNGIPCPYCEVDWFIQEKYKIAGLVPGNGNTTNIASIVTNDISTFGKGEGPFAELGERYFREYWANFGTERRQRFYRDIEGFEAWKREHADYQRFD